MNSRVYAGVGTVERRAERRARLLEAGLDLLGSGGLQAVTVRQICEVAKLSSRYFYESFADVDALVVEVFDAIVAELVEAGLVALATSPPDLRSQVRAALACAVDHVADDPRKGRVVLELSMASPSLAARRQAAADRIAHLIAEVGQAHLRPEIAEAQTLFVARFLAGGFSEALAVWLREPGAITRAEMVEDCAAMFVVVVSAMLNDGQQL